MRIISIIFASVVMLASLSACNTFEGLGQDIQQLGRGLENAADENK